VVGFIHYPPALYDVAHKSITHLKSIVYLLGSPHQQIEWYYSNSVNQVIQNNARLSKRASLERHHYEQINVRLRTGFAVGVRAKEHYLLRMKLKRDRATQQFDLFALLP
jgi:hypothetical protein